MSLIIPDKYLKNKHTHQYFFKSEDLKSINPSDVSKYNRKTYPDSLNLYTSFRNVIPYDYHLPNPKTIKHFGQLKLFIAIADFLLLLPEPSSPDKKYTFVYAGAAPGTNIFLIEPFFRNKIKKYILVDPAKFVKPSETLNYPKVRPRYSTMELHNSLFTDELLDKILKNNTDIVFMSDIRGKNPRDSEVIADNELQKNWVLKIDPLMASLKFRTPYTDFGRKDAKDTIYDGDSYPYLKGKVTFQAYAPQSSNESRLILKRPYLFKNYSISAQENRFFTFNRVYRGCAYLDPLFLVNTSNGIFDACLDCTHFYMTAKKILKNYNGGAGESVTEEAGVIKFMIDVKNILAEKL